jgi:hypothetical protein
MSSRKAPKRGIKVGVTLYIREGQQSLWENGIFQNCHFLLMLLKKVPFIEQCYVVNGGPGDPKANPQFLAEAVAPVISLHEALQTLDLVIELSAQVSHEWAVDFRARGGRLISMRVANDYIIDLERMIYGRDPMTPFAAMPYDQMWTLPAFSATNQPLYETFCRSPVRVMQHLWHPMLLEREIETSGYVNEWGYRSGRKKWRLAILEPNVCSVKTSHLPLLVCEEAYRRTPSAIEYIRAYNTMTIKEHPAFIKFATNLDIVKQGVASFEPRTPIFEIMIKQADAIVSHHWLNGQNYVYYEALHGSYPLIHNSGFIQNCGYRYKDYDCEDGGLALLQAHATHDLRLNDYKANAISFLKTLDPTNPTNVRQYATAMQEALAC